MQVKHFNYSTLVFMAAVTDTLVVIDVVELMSSVVVENIVITYG